MAAVSWFGNDHPSLRRTWHPVAWAAEVGEGPVAVELLGERWALARLGEAGELHLLADECPHRLAPLSAGEVVGGELRCAYHGYRFGAGGRCVAIPATGASSAIPPRAHARTAARVVEHVGLVWAALDEPVTPLPEVPEWGDERFAAVPNEAWEWRAGAAQMADNFLDVSHFPFTHATSIGDPEQTEVGECRVARDGWVFVADYEHLARPLDGGGGLVPRQLRFTCTAPHHVELRIRYPVEDVTLVACFFHQPLDRERTKLYLLNLRDDVADGRATAEETQAFSRLVGEEDQALLERFWRKDVPLGPAVEVHTRADRSTLELRRVLADLAASAPS